VKKSHYLVDHTQSYVANPTLDEKETPVTFSFGNPDGVHLSFPTHSRLEDYFLGIQHPRISKKDGKVGKSYDRFNYDEETGEGTFKKRRAEHLTKHLPPEIINLLCMLQVNEEFMHDY